MLGNCVNLQRVPLQNWKIPRWEKVENLLKWRNGLTKVNILMTIRTIRGSLELENEAAVDLWRKGVGTVRNVEAMEMDKRGSTEKNGLEIEDEELNPF